MSLGELALSKHAQSRNDLNLENISVIAICSGNVPIFTKDSIGPKSPRTRFAMLVFKFRVDNISAILIII